MTEAEQIAKFIAERGVTKCPPAVPKDPKDVKIEPLVEGSKADRWRRRQRWSHSHMQGPRHAKRS